MRLSNQSAEMIAQHKQPPGLTGEAAATAGIAFGAVAWGYGTHDAFHNLQSHEWFADVSELRRLAGSDAHFESSARL